MSNNEKKRFCYGAEEFANFVESQDTFGRFFQDTGLTPQDFLFLIRENLIELTNEKGELIKSEKIRELFSPFMRKEFSYLYGEKSFTVERRFKELLEMTADENGSTALVLWWDNWFAPNNYVSDDVYTTYDFESKGRIIFYIIETLDLPPWQAEYVKYFLRAQNDYQLSDYEIDILKTASRNLVEQGATIYHLLDELKS